jgi:uncharacterized membrane protein (UPF0136 family)
MTDSLSSLLRSLPLPAGAPPGSTHVTYTCAALSAAGGVLGFVRGRSLRSLAAGGVFGASFFVAAQFIGRGEAERGLRYGALTSAALAASMGWRLSRGARAVGPVGMLFSTGVAAGAWHGLQLAHVLRDEPPGDGGA